MQWKCIALCEAQPWCINFSKGNQLIKKESFELPRDFLNRYETQLQYWCFEWCNRNVKQFKWHALRRSFYDGINKRVHSNLLYGDVVVWKLFIVLANEMLVPSGVFSYHGTWEYVSFEVFFHEKFEILQNARVFRSHFQSNTIGSSKEKCKMRNIQSIQLQASAVNINI